MRFARPALGAALFLCLIAGRAEARPVPAPSGGEAFQLVQAKKKAKQKQALKKLDADDDGVSARLWRLTKTSDGPLLSFSARNQPEDVVIAFSCQPGSKQIRVVAYLSPRDAKRGDAARLRLTNGRQRLEIAATAFADGRAQKIDIGGVTRDGAVFLDVFRAGETMIVETPGRRVRVSLKTLGKKAEQFAAACGVT